MKKTRIVNFIMFFVMLGTSAMVSCEFWKEWVTLSGEVTMFFSGIHWVICLLICFAANVVAWSSLLFLTSGMQHRAIYKIIHLLFIVLSGGLVLCTVKVFTWDIPSTNLMFATMLLGFYRLEYALWVGGESKKAVCITGALPVILLVLVWWGVSVQ